MSGYDYVMATLCFVLFAILLFSIIVYIDAVRQLKHSNKKEENK